jgi:FAD synthetase
MNEVDEDPANRARRYIGIIERTIQNQKFMEEGRQVRPEDVKKILDTIHRYINDARYYLEHNKATTALTSVAYAEGLLDALKFLELSESVT